MIHHSTLILSNKKSLILTLNTVGKPQVRLEFFKTKRAANVLKRAALSNTKYSFITE